MTAELVFLHIPKTAGTSQHGAFRRYYGPDQVFWFGDDCPGEIRHYPADRVGDRMLVGGHKPLSFYPRDVDALFCTLLRDPVERAVSLFGYYSQPGLAREERGRLAREKILQRLVGKGLDPDSMVRSIKQCRPFRREISNTQCAYLSRSRADFASAVASLEQGDFLVGTVAQYRKFHDYLGELLDWPDESPGTENRSRSDYANEYLEDRELVSLVRELNQEDDKLLGYINDQHDGLYVGFRDSARRHQKLERLPLKPWKSRRLSGWEEAAAQLWPHRNDATRLPWPLNKLMVAEAGKLLYMSLPGPANPCVNRFVLECSGIENFQAVLDLGLGRVTARFQTGLMLADHPVATRRELRSDPDFFRFAVINEPVSRLVDSYLTHFVLDSGATPDHPRRAHLAALVAQVQGSSVADLERGISFREFVHAVLQSEHRRQHVLWVPQYLHLKGVDHYDKLYRQDQVELIARDLEGRCGVELHLPPSAPASGSAPTRAGAGLVNSGDLADIPAGELTAEPETWRMKLVDEELQSAIMDYYQEDCRLYDQIPLETAAELRA